MRGGALSFATLLLSCSQACNARHGPSASGAPGRSSTGDFGPLYAGGVDCPDGLARCENGVVRVSRLTTLPAACAGAPGGCACPWVVQQGGCSFGCAHDGTEVVVDSPRAQTQLCAPAPDASALASAAMVSEPIAPCDEGQRYLCVDGVVIDCRGPRAVGRCARGCFQDAGSIDDDDVAREAAFAILCSR